MFQISKLKSFINTKTLSVFAAALILGLMFDSVFGRYIFKYSIAETFTVSEAEAKIGNRVAAKCFEKSGLLEGTIISYQRTPDRQISVKVKLDKPLMEKFDTLNFDKQIYRVCFGEPDTNE